MIDKNKTAAAELTEEVIKSIGTADVLLSEDVLSSIFDTEDEITKARLIDALQERAKILKCTKRAITLIKAYKAEEKKLTSQYRQFASDIGLKYDEGGKPLNTIGNYESIIKNDPHFKGIRFNLLSNMPEIEEGGRIRQWEDADNSEMRKYIEDKYKIHNPSKCNDAFNCVCRERAYHPIKKIIDSIEWDGISRVEKFLCEILNCDDTPYTREASRLIFAGGIHRAYNPGCKFESVIILIGTTQGEGKSNVIKWLAIDDKYYTDLATIEGNKGVEGINGKWICELSELKALKNSDADSIKAFISRTSDYLRKAYKENEKDYPRQCVFIGTVNNEQFLTDRTGNRRFFPVKVHSNGYDIGAKETNIREYIKQCWAEAKRLYDNKELQPFPKRELIEQITTEQANAVEDDYRVDLISGYLIDKNKTCVLDLWYNALHENEFTKPKQRDSREIGLIMQGFKEWEKGKFRMFPYGNGDKIRGWKRKGTETDDDYGDLDF